MPGKAILKAGVQPVVLWKHVLRDKQYIKPRFDLV